MASTSLFAPQVESVQPAFIYNELQGEVNITFSFSSYNSINDISGLMYSIVDPNLRSTWGNNSMVKDLARAPEGLMLVRDTFIHSTGDNYVFSINLLEPNIFKTFTKNQFYQIQLYFIDKSVNLANVGIIDNNFLTENKDNISLASQVTLIRPVGQGFLVLEDIQDDMFSSELSVLRGYLRYPVVEDNIEGIDSYRVEIYNVSTGQIIYSSPVIQNFLGVKFELPIKCSFESGTEYSITFFYTTKHGRYTWQSFDLMTLEDEWSPLELNVDAIEKVNQGALLLDIEIDNSNVLGNEEKFFIIKRSDEYSNFTEWQEVLYLDVGSGYIPKLKWYDFFVENGTIYQYRFYLKGSETNQRSEIFSFATLNQEDLFLSNKEGQLAIKFNPKISNFKYVTQESIMNTLGGKFPLIRKNGTTRYRQFSLTGTLFFETDNYHFSLEKTFEDLYASVSLQLSENEDSFYYGANNSFYRLQNNGEFLHKYSQSVFSLNTDLNTKEFSYIEFTKLQQVYSKHLRKAVIDFLTNGTPKLFRSPTEGNMIVHLSNVSFTPNAQLGRAAYDFSATVTELCEFTPENFSKYVFNTPSDVAWAFPESISEEEITAAVLTPYLNCSTAIIVEALILELEGAETNV